jgi:hypothetical protein
MMRSVLLALVCLSLVPVAAHAQWIPEPRIAAVEEFNAFELSTRAEFLEERGRELERRSGKAIPGQFFAGFAGMVVGASLGAVTGLLIAQGRDNGNGVEAALLIPTAVGLIGGTTYGVVKFSERKGARGSVPATIGGTVLGMLGGPFGWVTIPLGARWAYNKSRTDTLDSVPR